MKPKFAYVGCFTTEKRKARGEGIAVFRIDQDTGAWSQVEACDAIPNPSYICLDRTRRFLYSAHGDSSEIGAWAVDPRAGKLRLLNRQPTGGDNSSTVEVDAGNRHVVLSTGPGVAVFPINADGSLAPYTDLVIPQGEPGPYRREQKGPHPHQATFDLTGRFVLVPDKGLDKVLVYRFDAMHGKLAPCDPPFVKARYGAIPRHITFHPARPYAYVVNEQDSTVNAYHWDTGRGELRPFQRVPTTPTTYVGDNMAAEIAILPSGKFLYASNRGHDSIAIFAVDPATGMLDPVAWEPVRGRKPRFFALDPDASHLYAANEDSHAIVVFRIDQAAGKLTPTGQVIETGSPTCIVFKTR
ncbi:MAG: lactonase family protein [Betaproteobacteria bacterium]|nr:lactonase family protein [Betaproteobacteria bacterium]